MVIYSISGRRREYGSRVTYLQRNLATNSGRTAKTWVSFAIRERLTFQAQGVFRSERQSAFSSLHFLRWPSPESRLRNVASRTCMQCSASVRGKALSLYIIIVFTLASRLEDGLLRQDAHLPFIEVFRTESPPTSKDESVARAMNAGSFEFSDIHLAKADDSDFHSMLFGVIGCS
jgi:hypothetical protein